MADRRPAFPNYTQLPIRVPIRAWQGARTLTFGLGIGLVVVLLRDPDLGLKLFWGLLVPLLPLVWLTAPGFWRNVCPLASSNQVPRVFGFTLGRTAPKAMARFAYQIGIAAFLVLVPARKVLFNRSGTATAVLLVVVLVLAFVGGTVFKGKAGWCSTICPLLPVQRLYGETPFLLVRNSHCEPCVGCAKNCYDFNPRVAKLADLDDDDPLYVGPRRFFAAVFPGLVIGFFSMPNLPAHSTLWVYGRVALFVAVSVAAFTFAESFLPVSMHELTAVFAAAALDAFYWYSAPTLVDTIGRAPAGTPRDAAIWVVRLAVFGLTLPWLLRTFAKKAPYRAATTGAAVVAATGLRVLRADVRGPSVRFVPDGPEVVVDAGTPLLDVIETAGLPIEAGCRMGTCGADPIAVVGGDASLSPVGADEAATLARLGLGPRTRLACQARVHGGCEVSLTAERMPTTRGRVAGRRDPSVRTIVVVGNGIAGTSAADHARRHHPDCEIHLVGSEPHRLYNRMAISRLIYGRTAMEGLYLLPDSWPDDNAITSWLNTRVRAIDAGDRTVALATGETLRYDRLVVATGSRSVVPDVRGIDRAGSFTLRRAEDAIAVRAFAQDRDVRAAAVAGGGVLGLEAAYALHRLGLRTTVLERGPWLMRRELDEPAARLLARYLDGLGITVVTNADTATVEGDRCVRGVRLVDGREVECGVFLACPGIVPNVEVAAAAGLRTDRAVVVDRRMQTSDPAVYAAGEVAEVDGMVVGLWPHSTRMGEVAGINAVGGDAIYTPQPATTLLKVVGVDVASIGEHEERPGDHVFALEEEDDARYRKVIVRDGRVVGAVLVGHSRDIAVFQEAVEQRLPVSAVAGLVADLRPVELQPS